MEIDKIKNRYSTPYFHTEHKGIVFKVTQQVTALGITEGGDGDAFPARGGMTDEEKDDAANTILPHLPEATGGDVKVANLGAHERSTATILLAKVGRRPPLQLKMLGTLRS